MRSTAISLRHQSSIRQRNRFIGCAPAQFAQSLAASVEANKEIEIEGLSKGYQFKDYAAVSAFLNSHSDLLLLLREAHHKIKSVFGFDTEIALEVFTDPESDDGQKLFALIFTTLPVDEALACLERLDQDWWLDASTRANGLLNLDVEYI
ncbi:MAG: hypothetical protein AB7U82_34155 [Blastocatellales bacterium]